MPHEIEFPSRNSHRPTIIPDNGLGGYYSICKDLQIERKRSHANQKMFTLFYRTPSACAGEVFIEQAAGKRLKNERELSSNFVN